ncbi:hypothetical protein V8G54_035198 [Vigna mungo]|uniref:Uncharacterized protein n=1 Tax=Vigna mungo TaxID=3915 RepID=A0AAQ3MG39_VIGMU
MQGHVWLIYLDICMHASPTDEEELRSSVISTLGSRSKWPSTVIEDIDDFFHAVGILIFCKIWAHTGDIRVFQCIAALRRWWNRCPFPSDVSITLHINSEHITTFQLC